LKPITISIVIPEDQRGKTSYEIVRVHNGVLEVLPSTYDPETFTLTFETDKFSTYGVLYSEEVVEDDTTPEETVDDVTTPGDFNLNATLFMLLASGTALVLFRKRKELQVKTIKN